MPPLILDEFPICILSNIISFLDQNGFREFVCLSRANRDAHLLPSNIVIKTERNLTLFHKWHILHRNLASVVPQVYLSLFISSDEHLLNCCDMKLDKLELTVCDDIFTGHGLRHLCFLYLTDLSIWGAFGLIDSSLIHISQLPLTTILISHAYEITGDGLKYLSALRLSSLTLYRCNNITSDGIIHLVNMPLTNLNLSFCTSLTDEALLHLMKCPLTCLNLSGCQFTDAGISYIAKLPLTELNLRLCSRLTHLTLLHLTQCILHKLDVSDCPLISSDSVVSTLNLEEDAKLVGVFIRSKTDL